MFLTGGCASIPNFTERLSKDLKSILPFQTNFCIRKANSTVLDAWYGARKFANSENFSNCCITKQMYSEMGGEYLKEHYASNRYFNPMASSSIEAKTDVKSETTDG